MEQVKDLSKQIAGLQEQLREARSKQSTGAGVGVSALAPSHCGHCGMDPRTSPQRPPTTEEEAAALAAADEPALKHEAVTAAFGPERLRGIERAVALLRQEHAKELTVAQAGNKRMESAPFMQMMRTMSTFACDLRVIS